MHLYRVITKSQQPRTKDYPDGRSIVHYIKKDLIAYTVFIYEEIVRYEIIAVSEQAVREYLSTIEVDLSKHSKIKLSKYYETEVEYVKDLGENPFEVLNPKYVKVNSTEILHEEFLREADSFCCDEIQNKYKEERTKLGASFNLDMFFAYYR